MSGLLWTKRRFPVSNELKLRITHIEIRRVQNGFVVMGLNVTMESRFESSVPQRVSFVATNTQELGALVQSIADGAELDWLPTVDLPIFEMRRAEHYDAHKEKGPAD